MKNIQGIWVLNETLNAPDFESNVSVNFISNGRSFGEIRISMSDSKLYVRYIFAESEEVNDPTEDAYISNNTNPWKVDEYRTVDFGDINQEVSKKFFDWLVANATPQPRNVAGWIELKKERYLTADNMSALNNNFIYLRDYYLAYGVPVGELCDITVTYNISPADIQQKFNDVERNIQTIQNAISEYLNVENQYFKIHTWNKRPIHLKAEVYRWIDWLNETKNIITKS